MKINRKEILIGIIFFILGISITYTLTKPHQIQTPSVETKSIEVSNPLGFIASVSTPKGAIYILIDNDHISFNPYETAVNNDKFITLKKEEYPKLFKQGVANYSVIQAKEYIDPQSKEIFIKLSNSQPDHGGFASTYVLLINPFTGEIKEGKNDYSD